MRKGWGRGLSPNHNLFQLLPLGLPFSFLSAPEERLFRFASGLLLPDLGVSDLGFLICQVTSSSNIPLAMNMYPTVSIRMALKTLCLFLLYSPVTR